MKKVALTLCLALVTFSFNLYSQCAALFEVSGVTSTIFCGVTGSSQFPITVAALGSDSISLTNLVSLGDEYHAVLICSDDSFYIHRQISNGRDIEGTGSRISSIIAMNITEYDTSTGSTSQSCSGTYTAPAVSIDPVQVTEPWLSFTPNPIGDYSRITLRSDVIDPSVYSLNILDLNGSVVHRIDRLPGTTFELNSSDLSQGLYFFQLKEADKVLETGKILRY